MSHTAHLLEKLAQNTVTADEAQGRVMGWLPGIVTDVDTKLKQVRARIGKQGDNESTEWIPQMGMGSIESLPEVGDPIGVIFQDGDIHRGAFFYFPQSTTKNRPMQPIPLGTSFVGMFNFLVEQLNQLQTDHNTLANKYSNHVHVFTGTATPTSCAGTTNPTTSTVNATTSLPANKGKASDGSVVSNQATSAVVLSKRSTVR